MQTCNLFGDQCFRRNMVYTMAKLSVTAFYSGSAGYYFSPSQSTIDSLVCRVYRFVRWEYGDANIYYARVLQSHTTAQELRCCLFVFDS